MTGGKAAMRLGILVLVAAIGGSPLMAVRKDTQLILDELQKILQRQEQMELKLSALATEVSTLSSRFAVVDDRVGRMAMRLADQDAGKDGLVQRLMAIQEELQHLRTSMGALTARMQPSGAENPTGGNGSVDGAAPAPPEEGGAGVAAPAAAPSMEAVYYAAYEDYLKGNYDLAARGFRQFMQSFPQSELVDNALYWIGECLYAQKRFSEAVETFDQLFQQYQNGDKIVDSLLKKAYALLEMGRMEEGLAVLRNLISQYPLSEEASIARQRVKEIAAN